MSANGDLFLTSMERRVLTYVVFTGEFYFLDNLARFNWGSFGAKSKWEGREPYSTSRE